MSKIPFYVQTYSSVRHGERGGALAISTRIGETILEGLSTRLVSGDNVGKTGDVDPRSERELVGVHQGGS